MESSWESDSTSSESDGVVPVEEILAQAYFIGDCLPNSLIRATNHSHPSIVVAGSFALWLSLYKRKGAPPNWTPNDVDIFVTGMQASREVKFEQVCEYFKGRAELKGHVVESVNERMNFYCQMGIPVRIVDVKLKSFSIPFSFIRYQHVSCGAHVVDNFDINIVQVWMEIYSGALTANDDDVWYCIDNGIAKVSQVVWEEAFPSAFEQKRLELTFARMRKFTERGFYFQEPPSIFTQNELLGAGGRWHG
jgi:hypothetical protein